MIKGKVLIVDDEPMVTRTLAGVLRLENALEPATFNEPAQALEYLRSVTVDAIVSDFIMPEINGLEFLGEARQIQPETSRILLTGYADKDSAIRSINEIGLFQYIEKPWDNQNLLLVLRNAVERSQLLRKLRDSDQSVEQMREKLWRMLL